MKRFYDNKTNPEIKKLEKAYNEKYDESGKAVSEYMKTCDKNIRNEMNKAQKRMDSAGSSNERAKAIKEYFNLRDKYFESGSKELYQKMSTAESDRIKALNDLHQAKKNELDSINREYINKLSTKTLTDLGSEYSENGRDVIYSLISDNFSYKDISRLRRKEI